MKLLARTRWFCLTQVALAALTAFGGICTAAEPGTRQPSQDEFEAAVQAARPFAAAQGLSLHTDALWHRLLQARAPLMALRQGNRCLIGYSSYTPGRRFDGLFPALPAAQARLWLDGLIHHELAHCLEDEPGPAAAQSDARAPAGSLNRMSLLALRRREARADLAFALHVENAGGAGQGLVERLMQLRQASAAFDPGHDSTQALRCYLAHPARGQEAALAAPSAGAAAACRWVGVLAVWQARCPLTSP